MRRVLLIFVILVGSITMALAKQHMKAETKPVNSEVASDETPECPNCHVPLTLCSKYHKKYGPKSCYHCKGDGLIDDVDRNGRIIKNALTCRACDGTGKEINVVVVRWWNCKICKKNFRY